MNPWTIKSDTPTIAPGQIQLEYDSHAAGAAHVIVRGDEYLMTYWGIAENKYYILSATSPIDDPNNWTAVKGPLLSPQPGSKYNCQGPSFPFLLPVTEDYHLLYYTGWGTRDDGKLPNTMGVAESHDGGKTFQYIDKHPVIPNDQPYDMDGAGSLWVMIEDGLFRMWYTCIGHYYDRPEGAETGHGATIPSIGIGYAESDDGINWRKPLDHRVVEPRLFGIEPYEYICSKPAIVKNGDTYTLWVNTFGTAYRVHRLTSTDGLNWEWGERQGPEGELSTGEAGAYDGIQRSYPTMVAHEGIYRCWFTGNGFGNRGMGYAESKI
ncbi:MAG: hypothetical protein HRT89_12275 [Lentisphaeria bacterium]|nr:hypothetical protein [Lentisphaeria bacterium]NQZ68833.1 hypothetical protein [Lentisphaeria bacterium]